jgi:hypothetical protein
MTQEALNRWKLYVASELATLQECYLSDRLGLTPRPDAPIDEFIKHLQKCESPLLFKAFLSDLYLQIQRQQKRERHSTSTLAQVSQTLLAVDRVLKEFRVDLGSVINDSDLNDLCINQEASSVFEEKLRTIERVTGHPLATHERRYLFAQWSLENPINHLLFPVAHQVGICESTNLAELSISDGTLVICQRIEPKPVIAEWHTLIMNYPLDRFFSSDASIFPKDLSWVALFCHGDYGVFARRDLGVTV